MNRAVFYNAVRAELGSLTNTQVAGFELILTATDDLPENHRAYLLATAWHETARTMQPVREALAKTDDGAIRALEKAWSAGKLKWVKKPYWRKDADGKAWFGRGYVQLTHKANYQKASDRMGINLVADPSAAMSPMIAARILVQGSSEGWFTGKKLGDYLPGDYINARRVINGTDRAGDIAELAKVFEAALRADDRAQPPVPVKQVSPAAPAPAPSGFWAAVWAAIRLFFASKGKM